MSEQKAKEILDGNEQSLAIKAIYDTIEGYTEDMDVNFEDLDTDGESNLGVFTMPGSVYDKKFIDGSFEATLSFAVVYRASVNVDSHKFGIIEWLDKFGEWLSKKENYPALSDGRVVERINQVSTPCRDIINPGFENDYTVTFQMRYRKDEE